MNTEVNRDRVKEAHVCPKCGKAVGWRGGGPLIDLVCLSCGHRVTWEEWKNLAAAVIQETTTTIELSREALEAALPLRNSLRTIYIVLCHSSHPMTAEEIALAVGHKRAYVSMRLNQLVDMGLAKRSQLERKVAFETVIPKTEKTEG